MVERLQPILKLICVSLAALVLYQISHLATRKDPLESLTFLAMPSLLATPEPTKTKKSINPDESIKAATNAVVPTPESGSSNALALKSSQPPNSSNSTPNADGRSATRAGSPASRPSRGPGGMDTAKAANLPPAVQVRVEKITQSEILGTVVRPLPMALLGIAGKDAFLRAPNGQTGLLREGDELGGIKLLRIGTNRVLIEHELQQKELTLFSGFGGETLLPKGKANPQ